MFREFFTYATVTLFLNEKALMLMVWFNALKNRQNRYVYVVYWIKSI